MGILYYAEESRNLSVKDNDDEEFEVLWSATPSEHFEGVEKRLQIDFFQDSHTRGLRNLSRCEIEQILDAARCSIVRKLSSDEVDTYVLSESSLFVYSHKVVIKTCGTTKLLDAVPELLELSAGLSLRVKGCKYSRAMYDRPESQPFPHGSFSDEADFLNGFFGKLGSEGSKAYVLTDPSGPQRWHIYSSFADVNDEGSTEDETAAVYTLEMCMTQLSRKKAANFFRSVCVSASEMTKKSGIGNLLPKSEICDFAFDPCGYSMNSVEKGAVSTIHVTPEKDHSYASFETMGYGPQDVALPTLVGDALGCFQPGLFSIAIHASNLSDADILESACNTWLCPVSIAGYTCTSMSFEPLPGDGVVMFQTYLKESSPRAPLPPREFPLISSLGRKKGSDECMWLGEDEKLDAGLAEVEQVLSALDLVFIGLSDEDMDEMVRDRIVASKAEEAFYVMDVGAVLRLWRLWRKSMPRVHPFYAVKCNPDRVLLSLLAALGAGFDVASKAELDMVESLGVGPDRIIFANPCKLPSHIAHAVKRGVHLTTFDSESELRKLHKLNPSSAEAVLRIKVCDRGARCPLGVKYGAKMEECKHLLSVAKSLGVQIVGVAFHVGSGASNSTSFAAGICQARQVFDMAASLGMKPLRLLDIGGGFVSDGGHGGSFGSAADSINKALEEHFPASMGVCVIAEPGRFFAEEVFTLAAQVYGSRVRSRRQRGTGEEDVGGDGDDDEELFEYWVNDGIYGSMNCLLYDHATLSVRPLRIARKSDDGNSSKECYGEEQRESCYGSLGQVALARSTIFGPTCDSLDTIMEGVMLPRLACGDWLIFPRMGAYTKAAASAFNGFDITDMKTVCVLSI